MRGRDLPQRGFGLGEGDEQRLFAPGRSFKQELQADGGLARARAALNQMEFAAGETVGKDCVKSLDARGGS